MIHDNAPVDPRDGPQGSPRNPFGRIADSDGSQEKLRAIRDLANIAKPVGIDLDNEPEDVARVEMLLDQTGDMDLKPSEGPTGYVGQRLIDAIVAFQKRNKLPPSGFIHPGDATHRALVQQTGERGGQPTPPIGGQPDPDAIAPGGPPIT